MVSQKIIRVSHRDFRVEPEPGVDSRSLLEACVRFGWELHERDAKHGLDLPEEGGLIGISIGTKAVKFRQLA